MSKGKEKTFRQFAALPYAVRDGEFQVALVTTRETGRWIIPKGWPVGDLPGPDVAIREAFEEAGVVGDVGNEPVGSFQYVKRMDAESRRLCDVLVFPLAVREILEDWPERHQRRREWMTPAQAAMAVEEAGLIQLMLDLTDFGDVWETGPRRPLSLWR
ncbi:MAG: NUDIX hydrolase [Telmatospirillum sp.]|nr:NUDIX hydrolase [Telmatospirillum sp.]